MDKSQREPRLVDRHRVNKMKSVVVIEPHKIAIKDIGDIMQGPYQAKVRNELACVCNATDRKIVSGKFPGVNKYPLLLGHESVGIVEAVGEKVRNINIGDRVVGGLILNPPYSYASAWGGFSEHTLATDHLAMKADGMDIEKQGWFEVFEVQKVVPSDIPAEAALMLCTWREVYAAFGDFNIGKDDSVLVFGAGPVGLSFIKFAKLLGLKYIGVVEPQADKRRKSLEMGADEVFESDSPKLKNWTAFRDKPLDVVIDAVGSVDIVNNALSLIKLGGSVCLYGVLSDPCVTLKKEQAPYNFNLLVHQWPTRWREVAAQEPLCEWIRRGVLTAEEFISEEYSVMDAPKAIDITGKKGSLKTVLRF